MLFSADRNDASSHLLEKNSMSFFQRQGGYEHGLDSHGAFSSRFVVWNGYRASTEQRMQQNSYGGLERGMELSGLLCSRLTKKKASASVPQGLTYCTDSKYHMACCSVCCQASDMHTPFNTCKYKLSPTGVPSCSHITAETGARRGFSLSFANLRSAVRMLVRLRHNRNLRF